MRKITAEAYAKINLTLDITGRREDGYHLLRTVMQSISLHDTLVFELSDEPGIAITSNRDDIPTDKKNTVCKAFDILLSHSDTKPEKGVSVYIEKRIPSGAGLGGGSSDAAAALLALNRLFGLGLKQKELIAIGAEVGADVPFFICGGTVLCEGIGEKLTPLIPLINFRAIIVKSAAFSATPEAYKRFDSMHINSTFSHDKVLDAIAMGSIKRLGKSIFNILEFITERSVIDSAKNALLENEAIAAQMTGSGSAVFGLYKSRRKAEKAYKAIKDKFEFCELCEPQSVGVSLDED